MPPEEPREDPDAVTVTVGDTTYRLVLPDRETDYIQGRIAAQGSPYEPEMLADMASRLSAGDVVVDVGANVGNHTVYLAAVAGCRLEAFEPDASLAEAIVRSARLNRLTKKVNVHPVALGAVAGAGTLVTPDRTNIGGQHVDLGQGDVPVRTLDEVGVPRPVKALKVDVEGMELDVLRGGQALVAKDRPLLYVECGTEAAFGDVASWLDDLGYAYWDTFNATPTHLFLPAEGIPGDQLARRLLLKTVRDGFRSAEMLRNVRAKLDEASLKYRSSTQAYETLRRQHADLTARFDAIQQELSAALSSAAEAERAAAEHRATQAAAASVAGAELSAARADAERLAGELTALGEHVERYRSDARAAQAELANTRASLDEVRRDVSARDSALAAAEATLREMAATRDAVLAERDTARRQLADADASRVGLEERVRSLDARLGTLRAELEGSTQALTERAETVGRLERERDEARHWLGERERERDEARHWLGERERERDEARRWLGERERERDEARHWLSERERELDEARRALNEVGHERDRLTAELAAERDAVACLARELEDARTSLRHVEGEAERLRSEHEDAVARAGAELTAAREQLAQSTQTAASLEGELSVVRRELESARREAAAAAVDLGVQLGRADELDRSVRRAWAESGEIGTAAARLRADAERLARALDAVRAQRDRALQIMAAAVEGERAALEREEVIRGRERRAREAEAAARAAVSDLRSSVTFRTGREIRRASSSFRSAVTLPGRLWRLSRERPDESRRLIAPPSPGGDPPGDSAHAGPATDTGLSIPDLDALLKVPAAPREARLRVAAIVDEFTGLSLEPECDLQHLTPTGWREELEASRPQLLFVESAWRGKGGVWHNTVGLFPAELRGIVEWCQARGIPTVFWNKEDPVHFSTFLTTARAFDHVFTTDIDCIGRYKAALGHDRVHLLPFAAQPRTHNPLEEFTRKDAISFAGSYYRRYPERTRDLDSFLEHLPGFRPVEIFDRNYGSDDPNYSFPEAYQQYVVGTLPPEEIARAYKGYRYAINLNSVKQSQTMFARRVFELLASNTVTVSNFSRGLRLLFGDLVVTTDSGREAVRRLSELGESDERLDRLRLLALRSVMSQHTYADRLAYVVARATGTEMPDLLPEVTFVGRARSQEDVDVLLAAVQRQQGVRHRTVLVLDAGVERPMSPGVTAVRAEAAEDVSVADVVGDSGLVGVIHPQDHYGPHYAFDLALGTRYCEADVLGKRTRCVADGDAVSLVDVGAEYRRAGRLPVRASLVRASAIPLTTLGELCEAADIDGPHRAGLDQVSLDRFSYCRGGAPLESVPEADADDATLWTGLPLVELQTQAESAPPAPDPGEGLPAVDADRLAELFRTSRRRALTHERTVDGWTLSSELEDGKHDYIYADELVPVAELWTGAVAEAYVDTTPGLRLQAVFLFFDEEGQRLKNFFALAQQNASTDIPAGAAMVKMGFRALGPGATAVRRVVLGRVSTEPSAVVTSNSALVLTNHYPAYENLYRNAFVHARVRAYRAHGVRADVFRLRAQHALSFDEFEGVDVATGSVDALRGVLEGGRHGAVFVHFLDRESWSVVCEIDTTVPVAIWIHGADVQPWWRRAFNYSDDAQREIARIASDQRLAMWREVFETASPNVTFVFVSEFLARTAMEDVGVELDATRYTVIHNPIDVDLFRYEPKPAEQRLLVLSIRPYASRVYANDLSVQAIQLLRAEPWFDELEFRLVGDGPLFDELVAPVRELPNVRLDRRFLNQQEIAALHRDYGVFLVPSRMDTQGVSRDEAMSSGLVPVTTAVAAVPEFVDDESGLVVEPENPRALASAIATLRNDPDLFRKLSAGAARRVRSQSAAGRVIVDELRLLSAPRAKIHEPGARRDKDGTS